MKVITFNIRLLEPVLVAQANSGEENSATAYAFIPGSTIRGALAGRYLQQQKISDPSGDAEFRRLFLDGKVRYLNGYPVYDEQRMLPTPFSWFVKKEDQDDEGATIFDFAVQEPDIPSMKNPKGDFCYLMTNSTVLKSSKRQVNIHTYNEDRVTHGQEDKGTVYRYESIASGEVFNAVIVCDFEDDVFLIKQLLSESMLTIGGAQTAGYGRVYIENVNEISTWEEYKPVQSSNSEVVITLLSDVILRNGEGHNDANFDKELTRALHLDTLTSVSAYQKVYLVGGFNRKWGLPLPQTWALQAGSVFVYRTDGLDMGELKALETRGIGERLAEGFGRFAVNWHTQAKVQRIKDELNWLIDIPKLNVGSESYHIAQHIAEYRLKMELDKKLTAATDRLSHNVRLHNLSNAQISRLRLVIRQASVNGNLESIIEHLEKLKAAKKQWEQAKIFSISLETWLIDRVNKKDTWNQLSFNLLESPSVAGVKASPDALCVPYMIRLIDGVLAMAMKKREVA